MIKLENVSVDSLALWYDCPQFQELIDSMGILSIKGLLDYIEISPEYDWSIIKDKINKVQKIVNRNNKLGKEPVIYPVDGKNYYEESLTNYYDTLNKGSVLLLKPPTSEIYTSYKGIMDESIDKIIRRLLTTTPNGDNYLQRNYTKIGPAHIKKIVEAIKLYHEQLDRIGKFAQKTDSNLFEYQKKEKLALAEEKYSKIITYLILNTKEFVWGKLTDKQKKQYLSSIIYNNEMDKLIKDRMINNVANYTTLKELKRLEKNDYKVLNRFIKN